MLFNSFSFIYCFLPCVFFLYYAAARLRLIRLATSLLFLGSLFFYGYARPVYLLIILASLLINYSTAAFIRKYNHKVFLILGIIFNLSLLCYFKYANFFLENLEFLSRNHLLRLDVMLPIGISFYTFQQIAYLADTYQKKVPRHGFLEYGLFVSFFPQLIAGPIVHYSEMMPQFKSIRRKLWQWKNIYHGLYYFIFGLFQKVVIADYLAPIADKGFQNAALLTFIEAWSAVSAYALQIYFDFAGYSNMAIGLGLFFNIRIPVNFNSPYQAASIVDFWRRWHITLSRFLRDYLYIPLGGNRKGEVKRYRNLVITMLLGGLWHGAAWTFVLWGGYHGLLLSIQHFWDKHFRKVPPALGRFSTLIWVWLGWVLFRAADMSQAADVFTGLLGGRGISVSSLYFIQKSDFLLIVVIAMASFFLPNLQYWEKRLQPNFLWCLLLAGVLLLNILFLNRASIFLYWQF